MREMSNVENAMLENVYPMFDAPSQGIGYVDPGSSAQKKTDCSIFVFVSQLGKSLYAFMYGARQPTS